MSLKPTLVENALLINEGIRKHAALLIDKHGRIERIARTGEFSLPSHQGQTIDAHGMLLTPGAIDLHVHFREPGLTPKGDIESESKAAVAGGVTSFIDMPNTKPVTDSLHAIEQKIALANQRAHANYAFYLGGTSQNIEQIQRANLPHIPAVKLFMGASTGNMQIEDPTIVEQIFKETPIPVAVHCEADPIINTQLQKATQLYGENIPFREHARIRPTAACLQSAQVAVELAIMYGIHLHILHLSTHEEVQLLETIRQQGHKNITAETCPHYLLFSDKDYDALQWRIKCNPAIKAQQHQKALLQALIRGAIDTIGTDHAPHLMEEKLKPYLLSPSGIPSIQNALPLMLELTRETPLTVEKIIELVAHHPAEIYQIERRGFLREGYHADLLLIEQLSEPDTILDQNTISRCQWTPYHGRKTHFRIHTTFVNGQIAYSTKLSNTPPNGKPMAFRTQTH